VLLVAVAVDVVGEVVAALVATLATSRCSTFVSATSEAGAVSVTCTPRAAGSGDEPLTVLGR
jgi:hypothetical protein